MEDESTVGLDRGRIAVPAGVRLGMLRKELLALLGTPTDVSATTKRHMAPTCYKYGRIEYFFGNKWSDGLDMVFDDETHEALMK